MTRKIQPLAVKTRDTLHRTARKFIQIDGSQRAAAFAYSAFFALFPLMVLLVAIASTFADRATASGIVITFVEKHIPLNGEMQLFIFSAISHVISARSRAGTAALLMLVWAATQFFSTLVQATNRAWGTTGESWWHLPLKNLTLLVVMVTAVLTGVGISVLTKIAAGKAITAAVLPHWTYRLWAYCAPRTLVFLSLTLFYKLAPRRRTKLAEAWFPALCATVLLFSAQFLFVIYLRKFASLSAVYGAFGGVMALMLWIYISGAILIFCACLCATAAARAEL